MGLRIRTTTRPQDAAEFIAGSILRQLQAGKRVLFFVTGGSGIIVGVKVAEVLRESGGENLINLTIMLTDERYGPVGHPDSNWQQLMEKGFALPQAKLIPVLTGLAHRSTAEGSSRDIAVKEFNENLKKELQIANENKYKIGLFGIGQDGHTAGILPESLAAESLDLACGYDSEVFSRITITFPVIEKLDEVVVWAQGQDKWNVIESLQKDIDVKKQPAQILKKVPLLTIFTDYAKQ